MAATDRPGHVAGQLALPLRLRDHAVFESFWAPPDDPLVGFLTSLGEHPDAGGCWIRGGQSAGKTHLLQAFCERLGDDALFLPLEFTGAEPEVLDGLASRRCVCLDNIDAVAGDPHWELALFRLFNDITDRRGILVVSARAAPKASGIVLADLESRLSRLPVFQIRPLTEIQRIAALQLRARHRGLHLPEETARYLLQRSRRDMASLYALLDRLDSESLKAKRRLTIPFVRGVLNEG